MSEYLQVVDRAADTLVIVFSHINMPAGQFSHFQTLMRFLIRSCL